MHCAAHLRAHGGGGGWVPLRQGGAGPPPITRGCWSYHLYMYMLQSGGALALGQRLHYRWRAEWHACIPSASLASPRRAGAACFAAPPPPGGTGPHDTGMYITSAVTPPTPCGAASLNVYVQTIHVSEEDEPPDPYVSRPATYARPPACLPRTQLCMAVGGACKGATGGACLCKHAHCLLPLLKLLLPPPA